MQRLKTYNIPMHKHTSTQASAHSVAFCPMLAMRMHKLDAQVKEPELRSLNPQSKKIPSSGQSHSLSDIPTACQPVTLYVRLAVCWCVISSVLSFQVELLFGAHAHYSFSCSRIWPHFSLYILISRTPRIIRRHSVNEVIKALFLVKRFSHHFPLRILFQDSPAGWRWWADRPDWIHEFLSNTFSILRIPLFSILRRYFAGIYYIPSVSLHMFGVRITRGWKEMRIKYDEYPLTPHLDSQSCYLKHSYIFPCAQLQSAARFCYAMVVSIYWAHCH